MMVWAQNAGGGVRDCWRGLEVLDESGSGLECWKGLGVQEWEWSGSVRRVEFAGGGWERRSGLVVLEVLEGWSLLEISVNQHLCTSIVV